MAKDQRQRIVALSKAHEWSVLITANSTKQRRSAICWRLFCKPYSNTQPGSERVHISTPKVLVGEKSATTLALVVHELATNSMKYGALSSKEGTIGIDCRAVNGEVEIVWTENGGPPTSKPSRAGFGTKLVVSSLSDQLGGTIAASWPPTGAIVTLKMSEARLGA